MNPLLLGQVIWDGAIGALSASAEFYSGAGLSSHLRSLVRERYPGLNQGQQSTLASFAFQSIQSARAYLQGSDTYTPSLSSLPDPRRLLQYASNQGNGFLDGTQREIRYQFVYRTRITDRQDGTVTFRENRIVIRSTDPLSRAELYRRGNNEAQRQVVFNSGTDPRRSYALASVDVRGVELSYGQPD